jgi:4-hydroxy-2-oxoheptanedioate aldolase
MELPRNKFKHALTQGRQQIGLWCSLASSYSAEIVAGSGFDWLLLDTEHSPSDVESVLPQLQAVASYDVSAVVRPATNDAVLIKRYLDIGAQTLLVPYVQSAEEASAAVEATRYPPAGIRGVSALTRATRFGRRATETVGGLIILVVKAGSLSAASPVILGSNQHAGGSAN